VTGDVHGAIYDGGTRDCRKRDLTSEGLRTASGVVWTPARAAVALETSEQVVRFDLVRVASRGGAHSGHDRRTNTGQSLYEFHRFERSGRPASGGRSENNAVCCQIV
jgi:hypothetical protein